MARARKGTLVWRKSGWNALVTLTKDGEAIRKWYALGTTDRQAARKKLTRLVADLAKANGPLDPSEAKRPDTVREFAEASFAQREAKGVASVRDERSHF